MRTSNFDLMLEEIIKLNGDLDLKVSVLLRNLTKYHKKCLVLSRDNPMIQENLAIPTFYIQGFDITYCKFYGGFIINMLLISDYYCFSKNKTNTIFCFKKEEEAMTKLNELNELLRE